MGRYMTPKEILIELLDRMGAAHGGAVTVSDEELRQWPSAAVRAMKSQKLLTRAKPEASAVCPGCEEECIMPVHTLPATSSRGPASFIVCDKRNDINRVAVSTEKLTRWRCNADAVARFLADCLGLTRSNQHSDDPCLLPIGIMPGQKRRQMLCLRIDGDLSVVAADRAAPLAELVRYGDGRYTVDAAMIGQLVDSATMADPRYTPTNTRREARKRATQEMYKKWQKAYRDLKRRHPGMSDLSCARQIAKSDKAGRSADTIRKHMTP
jgi:hypothetical protein